MLIKNSRLLLPIGCSLLLVASVMTAAARSRTAASLKFKIQAVDSITGKPKSTYVVGEAVSVVFTVTNLSRRAQTISQLEDTYIAYKLDSTFEDEEPHTTEAGIGGTAGVYVSGDIVYWTGREPRKMTLGPGQSVSVKLADLRGKDFYRLSHGHHTLTATYGTLTSTISFRVVIDDVTSIPLLEEIAEAPVRNGDPGNQLWAKNYLKEIRLPSIRGLVTDTTGKPLKEVRIAVSGRDNYTYETRSDGQYYMDQMDPGATYTLTPSLSSADDLLVAEYTFEPASRTVTNLNSKLTGVNFVATRIRPSENVAEDREGTTARASSTLSAPDDKFTVENVIDGTTAGQWNHCCNAAWVDATPNKYPDWVEIEFKGPRAIDWINVYTLQDHPEDSHDPTLDELFTRDGITDFDVQYWNGHAWKTVPGGAIRGNRNVWRKIALPTVITNRIRVVVRKALTPYSKIMEIEAFHVNTAPVVKLTGQSNGPARSWFEFETKVSDEDKAIYKYTFSYGDGTPDEEWERGYVPAIEEMKIRHKHMYMTPGTYTATVRVMDHDNEGSEKSMTVTVTDPDAPKPPDDRRNRSLIKRRPRHKG